jgi:hypothetical protein
MPKSLVPTEFKTHSINQILESTTEPANTVYYAFIGDHLSQGSTAEEVNQPLETVRNTSIATYRDMIIGKKFTPENLRFLVNRYDWEENTVYDEYDDQKLFLFNTKFYVVVDEDSYKHVYKCLSNNKGAPSTVKPLFKDVKYDADLYKSGDDYYETSDGYQWRYLYSIDSQTFSKFATQKYIPIVANTVIQENAVAGSIDVIKVDSPGKNYRNLKTGKFDDSDFNRNVVPGFWYRLRDNPVQVSNFYANTILYLTSGTGAGQYQRVIQSEYTTGIGVLVKLEDQFTLLPDDTTTYEITPEVRILGNGLEKELAVARAVIDTTTVEDGLPSYEVKRIEMLDRGQGYTFATASVLVGASADQNGTNNGDLIVPTPASVRPILPPQGGHGANNAIELGAKRFSFYTRFNRDESGLVQSTNSFAKFGIIRDPLFSNVAIYFENSSGTYALDEKVLQINTTQLSGTWKANTSIGAAIERTDGGTSNYPTFYNENTYLFITDTSNSNRKVVKVSSTGSNTTAIALQEELPWLTVGVDNNILVFEAQVSSEAIISNLNLALPIDANPATQFGILTNSCQPFWKKNYTLYGETTTTVSDIIGIDINNRIDTINAEYTFDTFNQLYKIKGTTTDQFEQDELVTQQSTTVSGLQSSGYIHSWSPTQLNLTRVQGTFEAGGNDILSASGDLFGAVPGNTLDIVLGDLDPNTGAIIYLQNDIPVSREQNQSEQVRVILEF